MVLLVDTYTEEWSKFDPIQFASGKFIGIMPDYKVFVIIDVTKCPERIAYVGSR